MFQMEYEGKLAVALEGLCRSVPDRNFGPVELSIGRSYRAVCLDFVKGFFTFTPVNYD